MFKRNRWTLIFLVALLAVAAFLRFYRLEDYLQFLGDQGRDTLIVKRMIVNHEWTLLGPNASVAGFYTGPIYYYFMLPFLWLFNLNPVGPAVMEGIFGLLTILLVFWLSRKIWNDRVALVAATLTAFSPKMVEVSRFAWNPNPIPMFTLLMIGALLLAYKKNNSIFVFVAATALGIIVQLHYSGLVLCAVFGAIVFFVLPRKKIFINIIMGVLGFVLGESLFLLFEVRHGFPNMRSAWEFFTRRGETVSPAFDFIGTSRDVLRRLYETILGFRGWYLALVAVSSLVSFGYWALSTWRNNSKEHHKILIISFWLVLGTLGTGAYRGQLHDHYFMFLFVLPPILIGLLTDLLWQNRWGKILAAGLIGSVLYFELSGLYIWHNPNRLIPQTKAVDQIVMDFVGNAPFNFALIAPGNSDHAYRYYLELAGKNPVTIESPQSDPDRKSITKQLIVVCEQKCSPLGYSLWEVAGFGRAEIVDQKEGPAGIVVYKLIHYTGT